MVVRVRMHFPTLQSSRLSIAFAEVATHNHFVLDRGGKAIQADRAGDQAAAGATEDDHLRCLASEFVDGMLLAQAESAITRAAWGSHEVRRHADAGRHFVSSSTGTNVAGLSHCRANCRWTRRALLDSLARRAGRAVAGGSCARAYSDRSSHSQRRARRPSEIRARMIAVQEELDWEVYRLYGLIDEDLTILATTCQGSALGERAFEIALARAVRAGERRRPGSHRHGSTPITEIPAHWPPLTENWFSGGSSSSRATRSSGCWRSRSTSGGGRRSHGRSGRSGRCGIGCWTGWRTSGSGSMRRGGRCRGAWGSSPMRLAGMRTWCRCWRCGKGGRMCR